MPCPVCTLYHASKQKFKVSCTAYLEYSNYILFSSNRGHIIFDDLGRKGVNERKPQLNVVQSTTYRVQLRSDAGPITEAPLVHTLEPCIDLKTRWVKILSGQFCFLRTMQEYYSLLSFKQPIQFYVDFYWSTKSKGIAIQNQSRGC